MKARHSTTLKPVVTFNHVADAWELKRVPQLKPSTQYTAPMLNRKYLRPFFGQLAPSEIKTGVINDWIANLGSKGLQPKTVHNLWKQFRAVMNWYAQQNDEPKRAWYPTLPTIAEGEQRWFTQDEVRRIVEAAQGQYKVLFHLAAYSGLRSGELAGLHVQDLDLERGVIRVRRSVWKGMEVAPKTRKGYRDVWIDSTTVQMLIEHLSGRTAGRIFQSRVGTPLENRDICPRSAVLDGRRAIVIVLKEALCEVFRVTNVESATRTTSQNVSVKGHRELDGGPGLT